MFNNNNTIKEALWELREELQTKNFLKPVLETELYKSAKNRFEVYNFKYSNLSETEKVEYINFTNTLFNLYNVLDCKKTDLYNLNRYTENIKFLLK